MCGDNVIFQSLFKTACQVTPFALWKLHQYGVIMSGCSCYRY